MGERERGKTRGEKKEVRGEKKDEERQTRESLGSEVQVIQPLFFS